MAKCVITGCEREGQEREIFDIESNRYDVTLCNKHYGNWMAHGSKAIDALIASYKA